MTKQLPVINLLSLFPGLIRSLVVKCSNVKQLTACRNSIAQSYFTINDNNAIKSSRTEGLACADHCFTYTLKTWIINLLM